MKIKKPQLSRKAKTLIYSSVVLLALAAIIVGNFPITPWNAFRLAEKAHLAEPAKILGTESVNSVGQNGVIIAKSEELCMTYAYRYLDFHDSDYLVCKKKTGDLTFLSIAHQNGVRNDENEYCSIILFDEYPQAVRAELTLPLSMEYYSSGDKKHYEKTYTVTATRQAEEYFFFRLDWQSDPFDEWIYNSSLINQLTTQINTHIYASIPLPGKIRLYDKNDNLILEREMDLQNPSGQ